jgi:hypothetical protein
MMLRRQKAVELDDVKLEHLDLGGNLVEESRDMREFRMAVGRSDDMVKSDAAE